MHVTTPPGKLEAGLPCPDPDEARRSARLCERIQTEIRSQNGCIDFARFMELALYEPNDGYYTSGAHQIGVHGDFVTAPEWGNLFATCIAQQCEQILNRIEGGRILELGAGTGALAADVLTTLAERDALPISYDILEISPHLSRHQMQVIRQRIRGQYERVRWLSGLPDDINGVVIANEVVDAMPVTRFRVGHNDICSLGVCCGDGGFAWQRQNDSRWIDDKNKERLQRFELPHGYESELPQHAVAWVKTLADRMNTAVMLVIDYGFPAREYYHKDRRHGTIMCHYRHRAHGNPFINVGLQDITTHVDFSALAEAAVVSGLDVLGYTQQAPFLLALGLLTTLESARHGDAAHDVALTQEVKKLTLPHEMGELFKVIAFGCNVPEPLIGFSIQNHRGRL